MYCLIVLLISRFALLMYIFIQWLVLRLWTPLDRKWHAFFCSYKSNEAKGSWSRYGIKPDQNNNQQAKCDYCLIIYCGVKPLRIWRVVRRCFVFVCKDPVILARIDVTIQRGNLQVQKGIEVIEYLILIRCKVLKSTIYDILSE